MVFNDARAISHGSGYLPTPWLNTLGRDNGQLDTLPNSRLLCETPFWRHHERAPEGVSLLVDVIWMLKQVVWSPLVCFLRCFVDVADQGRVEHPCSTPNLTYDLNIVVCLGCCARNEFVVLMMTSVYCGLPRYPQVAFSFLVWSYCWP